MSHSWDELSKSLAEPVPRRESMRRLGAYLTGAVLAPFGTALAGPPRRALKDPCPTFCKCRNSKQQNACLAACRACEGDTRRICGSCGSYVCCGSGQTCCVNTCANLSSDIYNCGACGKVCPPAGPYEVVSCSGGRCTYRCVDGAVRCGGACTFVGSDPRNCGGCGKVCPSSAPYCDQGVCRACLPGLARCGGSCVDLSNDPSNCGACGNVCGGATPYCGGGSCTDCGGYGVGLCDGVCVNLLSDNGNCGGCGVACAADEICTFGVCLGVNDGGSY